MIVYIVVERGETIMKRMLAIIFIFIVLCVTVSCTSEENTTKPSASPLTTSKPTTAAASGQAVTEKEDPHTDQTYIKSTFIDLNGKKQVLDLGWVDRKKEAVELQRCNLVFDYEQVQNGHYYYLREDKSGENIVLYRDKGEKIFAVECRNAEVLIQGAVLYQNELYLLCLDRKMMCEYDAYSYFIKYANLKTGVINDISIESTSFDRMWIDENYIFTYENGTEYSWNCFDKRTGKRFTERSFNLRDDDFKLLDIGQIEIRAVDGKVYYMKKATNKSNLYLLIQIDLIKKEKKILFEYKPMLKDDAVVELADINEKGVFVRELKDIESKNQGVWLYQIPFNNGKMSKSKSANKWYSSYYKNHFVYMDKKNRMHHVNLKNNKDTVIVTPFKRVHSFMCAKEGIFIVYDAEWKNWLYPQDVDDDRDRRWNNSLSLELYYVDYRGEYRTKLAEEVGLEKIEE